MRLSQLFSQTYREVPADTALVGHQLLIRAGFIRQLDFGNVALLPLGTKVLQHIENALRDALQSSDAQEIILPRADSTNPPQNAPQRGSLNALNLPNGFPELVRGVLRSHRQLPVTLYQRQWLQRDDPHPNAALFHPRQRLQMGIFHLAASDDLLQVTWQTCQQALCKVISAMGLNTTLIEAGIPGDASPGSKQTFYTHPQGLDTALFCSQCAYSADIHTARLLKTTGEPQSPLPLEPVATPGVKSIASLAEFLQISESQTVKAVFYRAEVEGNPQPLLIFAVLRGDMALNEFKLLHAIEHHLDAPVKSLIPASDADILRIGATPGYASPIGIHHDNVLVVADEAIPAATNLVAGANREGYHLKNTNYARDYQADLLTDIAQAQAGCGCPHCGHALTAQQGVVLSHSWLPGETFGKQSNLHFQDAQGDEQALALAYTELELLPLLAAAAEVHHDEAGLTWPPNLAPYQVHLVWLPGSPAVQAQAEFTYATLCACGLSPLFDDRDERAGVKFNDADLIGLPIRVTLSERALAQGGAEVKCRHRAEKEFIPLPELPDKIQQLLANWANPVQA